MSTSSSSASAAALPSLARAQQLQRAGRVADAEAEIRAVLRQHPADADAQRTLARLLASLERHGEAIDAYRSLLEARPDDAQAHLELGQSLRAAGRLDEATSHFERSLALDPGDADKQLVALLHRGTVLDDQGRTEDAIVCFRQAAERFPQSADAWAVLGLALLHLRAPEEAEEALAAALRLDPARTDVIDRFGRCLQDQNKLEDAAIVFERLLHLEPERPLAAGRLLHCKMLMSDWTALDRLQGLVEAALKAGRPAAEPFGLQGYATDPALLHDAVTRYAAKHHPDRSRMLPPVSVGNGPTIRLGYLSGEFRNQATSVLLTEVLERHDKSRFEVYAFDNGWDDGSPLRRRIEAACTLVPLARTSDLRVAELIRSHRIDLLVNLNGYFGRARTNVFALRAAPIQVNYLGFPGTIGAPYIDYLIADRTVIPEQDRAHYSEQVVYLPDCYQANDSTRRVATAPATRAEAGLPQDRFVFACMNNAYKILPAMFDVWMRILQRVPGAVLLLYADRPETQVNLRHEAAQRGIAPQRLVFGASLAHGQHLRRLQLCDLFLDTWPYNAHTTGSDALWAGLPVLTCTGRTFPSRVGASLLQAVGLPELVTGRFADYEALAVALATDPLRLAALRRRLAEHLPTAPLYDTGRYTRHLEAAFEAMVRRARVGLAPQGFACEAAG